MIRSRYETRDTKHPESYGLYCDYRPRASTASTHLLTHKGEIGPSFLVPMELATEPQEAGHEKRAVH